jgi:hypothetical protein
LSDLGVDTLFSGRPLGLNQTFGECFDIDAGTSTQSRDKVGRSHGQMITRYFLSANLRYVFSGIGAERKS